MRRIVMLLATVGLFTPAAHAKVPYGEDITVTYARTLVQEEGIVWIDVREITEFEQLPKLDFVHHVPLSRFNASFADMKLKKDATLFVVCRSGKRSKRVQKALYDAGYTSVTNILGGMTDWYAKFPHDK